MRRSLILVHRWTGLLAGVYLFAIGLSGAILAFRPELQRTLYPSLFASDNGPLADPGVVIANIRSRFPGYRFNGIDYPTARRDTFLAYVAGDDTLETVFANPRTGEVIGTLPRQGWLHLLQELHYNLLLGGPGIPLNGMGAAALVVMSVTGLAIALGRASTRPLWKLHRRVGLWSSAWLLMWGLTGMYFMFPTNVRALVGAVSPLASSAIPASRPPESPRAAPLPADVVAIARDAMPSHSPVRYTMASSATAPITVTMSGDVSLYFDQYSGRLLGVHEPGPRSAGDVLFDIVGPLHMGTFGGWPVKVVWCAIGLGLPTLFVTGALLFWRRRCGW